MGLGLHTCKMGTWQSFPAAQQCEHSATGAQGAPHTGLGCGGSRELPEVGQVLLARIPAPPLSRGHCPYLPDEAVDTQRGERCVLFAQAMRRHVC